jgi:hypothetical protein
LFDLTIVGLTANWVSFRDARRTFASAGFALRVPNVEKAVSGQL